MWLGSSLDFPRKSRVKVLVVQPLLYHLNIVSCLKQMSGEVIASCVAFEILADIFHIKVTTVF